MAGLTDMNVFHLAALRDALPSSLNDSGNNSNNNNNGNSNNLSTFLNSNSSNNLNVLNNNNEAILTAALRAHLNYTNNQFNSNELDENEILRTLNKIAICSSTSNNNNNNMSGLIQKCLPPTAGANGNWKCESCNNINYARRIKCNRCTLPRFNTNSTNINSIIHNNNPHLVVGGGINNSDYISNNNATNVATGGGRNLQIGGGGGIPTATDLLMSNFLNSNNLGGTDCGSIIEGRNSGGAGGNSNLNQLFMPNIVVQQANSQDMNNIGGGSGVGCGGGLESLTANTGGTVSVGHGGTLCYNSNNDNFITPQLLQSTIGNNNNNNNNNFNNISCAAHHLLSNLPLLAFSPVATPTASTTAMTPHTSAGGISPATISSPTVDTVLPPTFTPLQIMLLKAKDVADKLLSDFQNLGDLDPTNKAIEVLKTALAMLGHLCDTKISHVAGGLEENNPLQGIGGPNFSAPTMLAHPDEFKNPSSFLKIYGDPLCANGIGMGGGSALSSVSCLSSSCLSNTSNPLKGQNGNWVCSKCSNINFPRRFRCNKCNEYRDAEGDEIVSEYAKTVYHQHLRAYRSLAAKQGIDIPLKRFGGGNSGGGGYSPQRSNKGGDRGGLSIAGGNTPGIGCGTTSIQTHAATTTNNNSINTLLNNAQTHHS